MSIAVIDIGTNTFNLLIASQKDGQLILDKVVKEFVFLGRGGINKKQILPEAMERGIKTMIRYNKIAQETGVEQIIAVATSAVRSSDNGHEFVDSVKTATGIEISVIPGDQEAEYIYKGAREATDFGSEPVLLMDVGGGSTEFIICNRNEILWKKSIEVGASRLFDQFHKNDPITIEEITNINQHLNHVLTPVITEAKKHNIKTLVGSSGSFTSFAKIVAYRKKEAEKLELTSDYDFDMAEFYKVNSSIVKTKLEERFSIPGLIKERAPMIVVGTVLVTYVLEKLKIEKFKLARYALKEGVASDYFQKNKK